MRVALGGPAFLLRKSPLFLDIQDATQHVVRSAYGFEVGLKPSLTDDLIDGFLGEIDIRQFQLGRAIASAVQDHRARGFVLPYNRQDPAGFERNELNSGFLKSVGVEVGQVMRCDFDIF